MLLLLFPVLATSTSVELISRTAEALRLKNDGSFTMWSSFHDLVHPGKLLMRTDLGSDSVDKLSEELNETKTDAIRHFVNVNRREVKQALNIMRNETSEALTILLGARMTRMLDMPRFVAPLIQAVDTYRERRNHICLYDYLPDGLRNQATYHDYFTPVNVDWYGIIQGDGQVLVHLSDEMGNPGYNGLAMGHNILRFAFSDYMSLGVERIVDVENLCAVDLNPRYQNLFVDVKSRSFMIEDTHDATVLIWREDSIHPAVIAMSEFEALLSLDESSSTDTSFHRVESAFYFLVEGTYRFKWFRKPNSSSSILSGFSLDWQRTKLVESSDDGCSIVLIG